MDDSDIRIGSVTPGVALLTLAGVLIALAVVVGGDWMIAGVTYTGAG
jgi:hypothetical protein